MTASIDLWSAEDTVQMLPLLVAGIALVIAACCSDLHSRRQHTITQLRRDLQAAENRNRELDKENRRLRWDNDQLRGVRSPAHHLGVARRRARRVYRAPAAAPPAWTQQDPHHLAVPSWPATAETAAVALALDPAPGEDTQPFVIPRDLVEAGR